MEFTRSIPVEEETRVGEARRLARRLAQSAGLGDTEVEKAALLATELATNLLKHARSGELLVSPVEHGGTTGVEIVSVDCGPGITEPGRAFADGYSTVGSPGTGLGTLRRMADQFDLHTVAGRGTVAVCRVYARKPAAPSSRELRVGAISRPYPGEPVCGDGWDVVRQAGHTVFLVTDGLGHGAAASDASVAAVRAFREVAGRNVESILQALDGALRSTRGAALAVAAIDAEENRVRFAGVGNISGAVVFPDRTESMVSTSGIVGHRLGRVRAFTYNWSPEAILVMHSDGVRRQWSLTELPGLRGRHPAVIAGALYRDHGRTSDDSTVLVAREAGS